jgi:hypothetical protein
MSQKVDRLLTRDMLQLLILIAFLDQLFPSVAKYGSAKTVPESLSGHHLLQISHALWDSASLKWISSAWQ